MTRGENTIEAVLKGGKGAVKTPMAGSCLRKRPGAVISQIQAGSSRACCRTSKSRLRKPKT